MVFVELFNAMLVQENIRPAFLLQPQDYNEIKGNSPSMDTIIKAIHNYFPVLLFSDNYNTYQGTIVSKKNYNNKKNITLKDMGKLLGYPCYEQFEDIDRSVPHYRISLDCITDKNESVSIFANVCEDTDLLPDFKRIANKIKKVLPKYSHIFKNIMKVIVNTEEIIPDKVILDKIIKNESLNSEENDTLINILYNIGFEDSVIDNFFKYYQFKNPIHRGMLITILLSYKYDQMEPFFPLSQYGEKQMNQVENIQKKFGNSIIKYLYKTS